MMEVRDPTSNSPSYPGAIAKKCQWGEGGGGLVEFFGARYYREKNKRHRQVPNNLRDLRPGKI